MTAIAERQFPWRGAGACNSGRGCYNRWCHEWYYVV